MQTQLVKIEETLGFPLLSHVATLRSIAHLFGASKSRCGLYVLAFPDDLYYIGQAVEVVRRFSQHRKNYDDILGFSFIPLPKEELDLKEKELIYLAEATGFKLKNAVHVTSIIGDTDFDLLVSTQEQDAFLHGGESHQKENFAIPEIRMPDNQAQRFSKNFDQYLQHELARECTALLGQYLSTCIPFPRRTEYSFWSVSCMPSTNAGSWPRLFAVNAATMELFVLGWERTTLAPFAFITVSEDALIGQWPEPEVFFKNFQQTEIIDRDYRDAGQDRVTLHTRDLSTMMSLLSDPGVISASKALNIRVMRKRACIYSKFHCEQLSNHAFQHGH